jgi:hypothetical protein
VIKVVRRRTRNETEGLSRIRSNKNKENREYRNSLIRTRNDKGQTRIRWSKDNDYCAYKYMGG